MAIDPKQVAQLRHQTGAGLMDCKRALEEAIGDLKKATEILGTWGMMKADKLAARETKEGRISAYLHPNGKVAALIELHCSTDFAAKNEEFQDLAKELALAVAAFDPVTISKEDISKELVEEEKKKLEAEIQGKPPSIAEKILEGKLEKNLYSQRCLLHMPFPKEDKFKGTYGDLLKAKIAKIGENIVVKRFVRFELGR